MPELLLELVVAGKPEPQGSAKAWVPTDKNGNPFRRASPAPGKRGSIVVNVTSDNEALKGWREKVALAARARWEGPPLEGVSLQVEVDFFLYRAQDQWGTGRNAANLKDGKPAAPLGIPDVDKLLRAVLDSLTGVVYKDDSQVTRAVAEKQYAVPGERNDGQGVIICVYRRDAQTAVDLPESERVRYVAGAQQALALA